MRSIATAPPAPATETPAPENRFWIGASAILILSIVMRQLWLGQASFHPDEAIHTHFSGGFDTYKYDPVYHGPLLYHLVASVFGLVGRFQEAGGQNDISARLVPSMLGVGLIALIIWPLRAWIGNRAALAGAALLAISPSLVTYSRRLLHDSLALFLTMGAVLCFLSALEHGAGTERGRNARIGLFAFMSLFLATKANCFFIAAMLGAFWIAWLLRDRIRVSPALAALLQWVPLGLFALICWAAIAYPVSFLSQVVDGQNKWIANADHRVFTKWAVAACAAFGLWLLTAPRTGKTALPKEDAPEIDSTRDKTRSGIAVLTTYVLALAGALWLYAFLFGQGAQILMQWGQTRDFPSAALTDGAANARGAIGKMLGYWGGQQAEPRLPGRHDYYLVLALLYEVPILLAAVGGIWHASKHRTLATDLLLWWSFSSWTIYAVANEKVPWLMVHFLLPLALLGGVWLAQIRWRKPAWTAAAVAGALFSLRGSSGVNFERGGDHFEPLLYAQTPEAFRDALERTLIATRGDTRTIWMQGDRQWPSVWYLRRGAPNLGDSPTTIESPNHPPLVPSDYRAAICEEVTWPVFAQAGWKGQTVDFLIWPRASWAAIAPQRYWRWFLTRDTLPQDERNLPQDAWQTSILAGKGEWSYQTAVIGRAK